MKTYERKTPQNLDCGITVFMKVMGAKWKPCIIDLIHKGLTRPSEMHRHLPEATPRVIDLQLRELEEHCIVRKEIKPGFPLRADYTLTERGLSLIPVITQMDVWGFANIDCVKPVALGLPCTE